MQTLCIEGGRVLRPDLSVTESDVLVDTDEGVVAAVGPNLAGDDVLNAEGCLVVPGLVNAHTHVSMTLLRGIADDKPLRAWLEEDIWPVEAELEPADIRAGAALGVAEMIRSGTTTFADMYFEVEETADVVDEAGLRAVLGRGAITVGKSAAAAAEDIEGSIEVAENLAGAADGRFRRTTQQLGQLLSEQFDSVVVDRRLDRLDALDPAPLHLAVDDVAQVGEDRGRHVGDDVVESRFDGVSEPCLLTPQSGKLWLAVRRPVGEFRLRDVIALAE